MHEVKFGRCCQGFKSSKSVIVLGKLINLLIFLANLGAGMEFGSKLFDRVSICGSFKGCNLSAK